LSVRDKRRVRFEYHACVIQSGGPAALPGAAVAARFQARVGNKVPHLFWCHGRVEQFC